MFINGLLEGFDRAASCSTAETRFRDRLYSLGVIGYELLSNRLPHDLTDLLVPQAAQMIQEAEPSRLSSISRAYRGDIETIIGKAIEKEPIRRYQSAAELAADIRRYLVNEPIVARPPTVRYQLGKFARRHKELVAGLVLVFLVMIGGIVATSVAMVHAQRQARDATIQAKRAVAASQFMQSVLASASPAIEGGGRDVRVADVLDDAAAQLDQSVNLEPEIEAQARWTIGESYLGLSLHDRALMNLQRALELTAQTSGVHSRDALRISNSLAWVLLDLDRYGEAQAVVAPAAAAALDSLGQADECTQELLYTAACVASAASDCRLIETTTIRLYDAIKSVAPEQRAVDMRTVVLALARAAQGRGDWIKAQQWIVQALAESAEVKSRIGKRQRRGTSLAQTMEYQRMWPEAERAWRDMFEDHEARYGPDHAETLHALEGLNGVLEDRRDFGGCIELIRRQIQSLERQFPNGTLGLAMAWGNIGTYSALLGDQAGAADAYAEAVSISRKMSGDDYFITQSWWREAVLRVGMGLHDQWASDALRWHCLRAFDDALRAAPTRLFDFDEIDWASLRFALVKHHGDEPEITGDLAFLKTQSDPPPGVYRLSVRAPRRDRTQVQATVWMLIAPWQVRAFSALPCTIENPELWRNALANAPAIETRVSSLSYANWWDIGFGPTHNDHWCGLKAEANINVPLGDYELQINLDDGARIWLDDQLILNDWTDRQWGYPINKSVPLQISPGLHHMRIEHFQAMGEARLWVRLEPATPRD